MKIIGRNAIFVVNGALAGHFADGVSDPIFWGLILGLFTLVVLRDKCME